MYHTEHTHTDTLTASPADSNRLSRIQAQKYMLDISYALACVSLKQKVKSLLSHTSSLDGDDLCFYSPQPHNSLYCEINTLTNTTTCVNIAKVCGQDMGLGGSCHVCYVRPLLQTARLHAISSSYICIKTGQKNTAQHSR